MNRTDQRRVHTLKEGTPGSGPVVYWMSRDQRAHDNWALLYSLELAREQKRGLLAVFCLVPVFLGSAYRQYSFMLNGLRETERSLRGLNIPFVLLIGKPEREISRLIKSLDAAALVADFDPLRVKRGWADSVAGSVKPPVYEVDAHNIVPCRLASPKLEFAAYTFRPKIKRLLHEFLVPFPEMKPYRGNPLPMPAPADWDMAQNSVRADRDVPDCAEQPKPGFRAALKRLDGFIKSGLDGYASLRNDPNSGCTSRLSPYLHFGQVSAQRVALEVSSSGREPSSVDAFMEELVVRKELSDNHCLYNPDYDKVDGFPDWARETLARHGRDRREYVYTKDALERGNTHDPLWNAAQAQMVRTGYMHGYMRMYWAKKILEWAESPAQAMEFAIYLNDRYQLDGRDPNGYTGIAWSIGGRHDRAWPERDVYGKIRYMNYGGAKRKFDVKRYIKNNLPSK